MRSVVPRSRHASWSSSDTRLDPVSLLRGSESQRLPELLAERYTRMSASPFGYLRGTAAVMAGDLATTPASGLRVQACGDAHIGNFRLLGTPERKLNFDLNDFDETLPAAFEWDLKRLAASAVVAGRHNRLSASECRNVARSAACSYRLHMAEYAQQRALDVWYSHIDSARLIEVLASAKLPSRQHRLAKKSMRRAREKGHRRALRRLTTTVDGRLRLRDDRGLLFHDDHDEELVQRVVRSYRSTLANHLKVLFDRYTLVDYAIRVVGVGSVGTRCWVALFQGDDAAASNSLVLQVKQAGRSVLEPYAGTSAYKHQGQRVVEGQRLIQAAGDMLLGWTRNAIEGVDYYVRQLWDMKGRLDTEVMGSDALTLFAELSGWTLARSHARSGNPAAISGYVGASDSFDRAITDFAVAYADQTERDHERLCRAVETGELPGSVSPAPVGAAG